MKAKSYYNKQWTAHAAEGHEKDFLSCLGMGLFFMEIKALGETAEIHWPGQQKVDASDWVVGWPLFTEAKLKYYEPRGKYRMQEMWAAGRILY
jgi:hypothetical protein